SPPRSRPWPASPPWSAPRPPAAAAKPRPHPDLAIHQEPGNHSRAFLRPPTTVFVNPDYRLLASDLKSTSYVYSGPELAARKHGVFKITAGNTTGLVVGQSVIVTNVPPEPSARRFLRLRVTAP
ncbi:MAG: hypothetical protein H7067_09120, partial [Burkholderiales bacterium]|nr:hypothetical protein [Opitutaceae bacterium]